MNGFTEARNWFSDENVLRRQEQLDVRWAALQKKGLKHTSGEFFKWVKRILWGTVLGVLLIYLVTEAVQDHALSVLMALPVIILIAVRRWWPSATWYAAGLLALYGLMGTLVFFSTFAGTEARIAALYGTVMLISVIATWFIDRKATALLVGYFLVTIAVSIVVGLVGAFLNIGDNTFPTDLVTHLSWVTLGLAAVVLAFAFTRLPAAVLVMVAFSAAGFHQFAWAYDGLRRQNLDVWGWVNIIPDQGFYGLLLLIMAAAISLAKPVSRKLVISEEDLPDGNLEGEVPEEETAETAEIPDEEKIERFRTDALETLYYVDKRRPVLRKDGTGFLATASFTPEAREAFGITPAVFDEHAIRTGVKEIRAARIGGKGVVRKDGTVNPNKLIKIGFRKAFLKDHGITREELLTGKHPDLDED